MNHIHLSTTTIITSLFFFFWLNLHFLFSLFIYLYILMDHRPGNMRFATGGALLLLLGYLYYRHKYVHPEVPQVLAKQGGLADRIANRLLRGKQDVSSSSHLASKNDEKQKINPSLVFRPAFLFANAHSQILLLQLFYLFKLWPKLVYFREVIDAHPHFDLNLISPDESNKNGDIDDEMNRDVLLNSMSSETIALDWCFPVEKHYHPQHDKIETSPFDNENNVVVVMLHGITGTSKEFSSMAKYIRDNTDWTSVVLNRRGHSDTLKNPMFNIMGSTHDLRVAVQHIRKRFPRSKLALVGSSAGSGLLTRYLGEEGIDENNKQEFFTAVAISPGYDIHVAFPRVHSIYNSLLTKRLVSFFVERNEHVLNKHPHPRAKEKISLLKSVQSISEFSYHASFFGLPLHVLDDHAHDHDLTYRKFLDLSCPMKVVTNIKIPTLVINAYDDPVCVGDNVTDFALPLTEYDNCCLITTQRGSHVCFIGESENGGLFDYEMFGDKIVVGWIKSALEEINQTDKA